MMQFFWYYFFAGLLVLSALALGLASKALNKSIERIARSYAPIGVKIKALTIEVSSLKRSRLARERRLETDTSTDNDFEE